MNDYELRRQKRIAQNAALLRALEADAKPLLTQQKKSAPSGRRKVAEGGDAEGDYRRGKRRAISLSAEPQRRSQRIKALPASTIELADDDDDGLATTRRPKKSAFGKEMKGKGAMDTNAKDSDATGYDAESPPNVEKIQAGWIAWSPTASAPVRDAQSNCLQFESHPSFTPNLSPEQMLRLGVFGGAYYRPLRSRKLGIVVRDDWREDVPAPWLEGLSAERFVASEEYDPEVNKFGVACGQSIEEWEAAGWIDHEFDVRGWFQWYIRFYLGRRCRDDERQVGRWERCVGPKGRWRRTLLKRYLSAGVRSVHDEEADEDAIQPSPVVHQTCLQWAWELRQEALDEAWAEREGGG